MNKAERHRIKMLKFKKRCINYRSVFNALRSDAKPCSCFVCKKERYKREEKPIVIKQERKHILGTDYSAMF